MQYQTITKHSKLIKVSDKKYQYSDIDDNLDNPYKFGAERIQPFSNGMITLRFKASYERGIFIKNYDGKYITCNQSEAFAFRYEVDLYPPY